VTPVHQTDKWTDNLALTIVALMITKKNKNKEEASWFS